MSASCFFFLLCSCLYGCVLAFCVVTLLHPKDGQDVKMSCEEESPEHRQNTQMAASSHLQPRNYQCSIA